jgi:hypothetical protein
VFALALGPAGWSLWPAVALALAAQALVQATLLWRVSIASFSGSTPGPIVEPGPTKQ